MDGGLTITMTREQATRMFNILSGFCNEQGAKSLRATEAGNAVMAIVYQRGSDQAYELVKIVGEALRPIERAGYRLVPKAEHDALLDSLDEDNSAYDDAELASDPNICPDCGGDLYWEGDDCGYCHDCGYSECVSDGPLEERGSA